MSQRARRVCTYDPRCPDVAVEGERFCRRHLAAKFAQQDSSSARGYTRAWADFSRKWLALHRWCGERQDFRLHAEHSLCVQQGLRTRAEVTDHIDPLRLDRTKQFAVEGLQSLCRACHNRKIIKHEGGFVHV